MVRVELVEDPSAYIGGVLSRVRPEYLARTYNESKGRALYFVKGYHPSDRTVGSE